VKKNGNGEEQGKMSYTKFKNGESTLHNVRVMQNFVPKATESTNTLSNGPNKRSRANPASSSRPKKKALTNAPPSTHSNRKTTSRKQGHLE